jgi:hypothetical protein
MARLISSGVVWLAFAALATAEEKTWEGKWNNKRFGTSGPLKCVATETEPGTWKAKFSGSFQGDSFSYDVTFDAKPGKAKGQQDLSGKATISGQDYEWKGTLKGTQLKGTYKSSGANFGEFVLNEPKKKK